MNIFNLEFQKRMPEILEAFTEVYGKKNEELLRKREEKIIYIQYIEPEEAKNYHSFLKDSKINELLIKYLKEIGSLNQHFEMEKNYQKFPSKIKKLLKRYLGSSANLDVIFTGGEIKNYMIGSFLEPTTKEETQNGYLKETRERKQICFLNDLRNFKEPLITVESYTEFKKTEEFAELYQKIQKYLIIIKKLNNELANYLEEINYLLEYYNEEQTKKEKLYKLKRLEIYENIKELIPKEIMEQLEEKFPDIEKRVDFLLSPDMTEESSLEFFSTKYSKDLENPNTSKNDKRRIRISRILFLEELGADVNILDHIHYKEIANKDEIKKLIPNEALVDEIITEKATAIKITKRNVIRYNKYFNKSVKNIANATLPISTLSELMYRLETERIKDTLYDVILKGNNCCFSERNKKEMLSTKLPVLFLLVSKYENAQLDYVIIHELTHALEFIDKYPDPICGFDFFNDDLKNNYLSKYRLYERLNETITDIISEKVRKILLKKGIYIAENKKLTDTKLMKNRNTDNILKMMLYPLFDKVEQELLDSRITGNIADFIALIGRNNFNDLNDAINKVDYLIQVKDLKKKLKKKDYQDPIILEYYLELDKVKKIYENIDNRLLEKNKTHNNEYKKRLL